MSQSVVVVGMNTRPIAQSAARAGWDVVAIDALGRRDLQSVVARNLSIARDLGGMFPPDPGLWHLRMAQAAHAQQVQALAYSGGFENLPDLVAEMSADHELLGNSAQTLRAVRDPDQLREVVLASGLRMPEALTPGATPDPARRWLRKRIRSGGGFAVEPWSVGPVQADPEWIVMEWVEGTPGSIALVANGHDARVVSLTRQLSGDATFGAPGFAYAGNLLIPRLDSALLARLERLAVALTRAFGLVGLNGVDFILNGDEVTVLEVNPRFSASMELVESALGISLFDWHVAGCRRQELPAFPIRQDTQVFGKAEVYARRDGVAPDTATWAAAGRLDIPQPGDLLRAGLPICTVTASGADEAECYASLAAEALAVWDAL
jgi:uncharacterized protein